MTEDDPNVTANTKECNYYPMVGRKESGQIKQQNLLHMNQK